MIDGSVKLDDINDVLDTSFDSENYNSLAGIMMEKLDRVPEDKDEVKLDDGTRLKICGMEDHRIKHILMELPTEPDDNEAESYNKVSDL